VIPLARLLLRLEFRRLERRIDHNCFDPRLSRLIDAVALALESLR
jgi:hypothetical protein